MPPKSVAKRVGSSGEWKWYCPICFRVYTMQSDAMLCCAPEKVKREMVGTKVWLKASMKPKNPSIGVLNILSHMITYCPEE